jgi:hypothetical protein
MLRGHGLQRGDRLMMVCENSVEAYEDLRDFARRQGAPME